MFVLAAAREKILVFHCLLRLCVNLLRGSVTLMCDVTLTPPLRSVMLFTPLALVRYILSQLGLEDRWLDGVWLKYVSCRFQSVTGKRQSRV